MRTAPLHLIRLAIVALALASHPAVAADFDLVAPNVISVKGRIELGDCERWKAAQKPGIEYVLLTSPGGRNGQGECISRSIFDHRLKTVVLTRCSSICFLMFAAGSVRSACRGARIGVHRPANARTKVEEDDPHFLEVILKYARRYGVPDAIAERLKATPSDGIYYLDDSDLASMHVGPCG